MCKTLNALFQLRVAAATPLPPWECWRLVFGSSPTTVTLPSSAHNKWSPVLNILKVNTQI